MCGTIMRLSSNPFQHDEPIFTKGGIVEASRMDADQHRMRPP